MHRYATYDFEKDQLRQDLVIARRIKEKLWPRGTEKPTPTESQNARSYHKIHERPLRYPWKHKPLPRGTCGTHESTKRLPRGTYGTHEAHKRLLRGTCGTHEAQNACRDSCGTHGSLTERHLRHNGNAKPCREALPVLKKHKTVAERHFRHSRGTKRLSRAVIYVGRQLKSWRQKISGREAILRAP